MFKRAIILISTMLCVANANQVNMSLPEAVSVNHKLIKNLYTKIETMDKKITELENKILDFKNNEKIPQEIKKNFETDSNKYFIAYNKALIRDKASLTNSKVVGSLNFGEEIKCLSVDKDKEWCQIDGSKYLYFKGLEELNKDIALVTQKTVLKKINNLELTNKILEKGKVVGIKGSLKENWYVTDDNLLLDKKHAVKSE